MHKIFYYHSPFICVIVDLSKMQERTAALPAGTYYEKRRQRQ